MKLIRRCTLRGAVKYILPITLLILISIVTMWLFDTHQKLQEENEMLVDTIENLEAEKVDLNSQITSLKEEKQQLKTQIDGLQNELEKAKESAKKNNLVKQASSSGIFKSYTDYRCLSRSSAQWKLQERAYTDENGLRKIGDAYLVALGSYYGTTLGTKYTVTLSNGSVFNVILCDCKKDIHTDTKNQKTLSDGSILEFYVDTSILPKSAKTSGTISNIDFFSGGVVSIIQVK